MLITDSLVLICNLGTALAGFSAIAMSVIKVELLGPAIKRRLKWLLIDSLGATGLALITLVMLAIGRPEQEVWVTSSGFHLAIIIFGIFPVTIDMWRESDTDNRLQLLQNSISDAAGLAGWILTLVMIGLHSFNLIADQASGEVYLVSLAILLGLAGFHFFGAFSRLIDITQ